MFSKRPQRKTGARLSGRTLRPNDDAVPPMEDIEDDRSGLALAQALLAWHCLFSWVRVLKSAQRQKPGFATLQDALDTVRVVPFHENKLFGRAVVRCERN